MTPQEIEKIKKAGAIASEARAYAKSIIKVEMPLLEIAEKIEAKIEELGGKPAFPVNLSMNDTAAHFTPDYNDETKASGLLKVDIGVHVDGFVADTALSIDLTKDNQHAKLIQASEEALASALKIANKDSTLHEIGNAIQSAIEKHKFTPVINLSGHSIEQYNLHSGLTIPNIANSSNVKLGEGLFAIEPFATAGEGTVYDSRNSGIYRLEQAKNIRDSNARKILNFIIENYNGLPFCSRWIVKKFSPRALISLSLLEQAGILHHFKQLVEKTHKPVSQSEHTILITAKETIVTTI